MWKFILRLALFNQLLLSVIFAQSIGEYVSHEQYQKFVRIYASNFKVDVYFYTASIVQIRFYDDPNHIFLPGYTVIADGNLPVNLNVENTSSELLLETDSLLVRINKSPLRFRYEDKGGNLLIEENTGNPALGLGVANGKKYVRFDMPTSTGFYGTGERGMDLNLAGHGFNLYNTQAFGYFSPPETMGANIPFFTSTNGFGIFYDNEYPAYLSFGKNDDILGYDTEDGKIVYYFIQGSSILEQIKKYTWLTGRQPLPPKWALGYIQSKYGYRNTNEARTAVNTFRAKGIPLDVIILDLYWFNQMGDISWNHSAFPDPQGMMAEFNEQGVKTVVISEPYITEFSTNYNEAVSNGYLAKNASGNPFTLGGWWSCGCNAGLLDITNPEAADWWWGKHPGYMGENLAGFWTDLGEPESHPWEMVHHIGSAKKVHNLYNLFWAKLLYENYNDVRPNERLFNLTRSGFAGIQRYGAITWSGDVGMDYTPFAAQIPIMLNSGMAGLAYEHSDLGGFCCGNSNGELYKKWVQSGTFSPVMRTHGQDSYPQEPWKYGTVIENNLKEFIKLRYRLFPYLYTSVYENSQTGKPITRPYIMQNEKNSALFNEYSGYYFGDNIVVVPAVSNNSSMFYLPEGKWLELNSQFEPVNVNQIYNSGYYNTSNASLRYFLKTGTITPFMPPVDHLDQTAPDTLYLKLLNDEFSDSYFTMYEDNGNTLDYKSGEFSLTYFFASAFPEDATALEVTLDNDGRSFDGKPDKRTYIIESLRHFSGEPHSVSVNDYHLQRYFSLADFSSSVQGFFTDIQDSRIYVKIFGSSDSSYTIRYDFDPNTGMDHESGKYSFSLEQNYPNPFNPVTVIPFSVEREGYVNLEIYNLLGEKVAVLVNEFKSPGNYTVRFISSGLTSGVYIYRLASAGKSISRKLTILK